MMNKPSLMSRSALATAAVVVGVAALAPTVHAANIFWDATASNGQIDDGAGQWSTSQPRWTLDGGATNINWNNTTYATHTAVFGAGAAGSPGGVSSSNGVQVGSVQVLKNGFTFGTWGITLNVGEINTPAGITASFGNFGIGGSVGVTKSGAGTVNFGSSNNTNYTGGTFINEGKLNFSSGTSGNVVNVASGDIHILDTSGAADATLAIEGNNAAWIIPNNIVVRSGSAGAASISYSKSSGSGTGTFSGNFTLNKDLAITRGGTNVYAMTYAGNVSGAGDLSIAHTANSGGSITFSGSHANHTGALSVSGNTLANTPVTLDSARGNSNMTFDKVAVGGTGSFAFNVANDVSDLISLANGATLSLNGRDLIPNLTGAQTQNEYVLVNTVTGVSGTFASIIDSSPSYDFAVDYDGTDANPGKVVLVLTVIPEPASLSLLAVAAGGLLGRRRA